MSIWSHIPTISVFRWPTVWNIEIESLTFASASPCQTQNGNKYFNPIKDPIWRLKNFKRYNTKKTSGRYVTTVSTEQPVSVWCKTAFFCLLFNSPLVTWFRFVLHYLRAFIHLQRTHRRSFVPNRSSLAQNSFDSLFFHRQTRPNSLRFRNNEEILHAVNSRQSV